MIPLDDALRPTWLFAQTVHEGCDRGGYDMDKPLVDDFSRSFYPFLHEDQKQPDELREHRRGKSGAARNRRLLGAPASPRWKLNRTSGRADQLWAEPCSRIVNRECRPFVGSYSLDSAGC